MADELPDELDFKAGNFDAWEADAARDCVMAVATERMSGRGADRQHRVALRRLDRNGPMARMASRRAYSKFLDEGGEAGDFQSFMEWLIANWDSILKMIMSIISLFTV